MARICARCLLYETADAELVRGVYDYIAALPPSVRAESVQYEARLRTCRACDHLVNGMCELCGCFVEVRAAKAPAACADTPKRW